MDAFDLTIFTIATNRYLGYFELQKDQIAEFVGEYQSTQVVVATNVVVAHSETYKNLQIDYVPIADFKWPDITLLRYHAILENQKLILGKFVMWLDTDMAIKRPVVLASLLDTSEMYFARQPGFVFSKISYSKLSTFGKIKAVVPWIKATIKFQPGAGTWENRPASKAYVPPIKRVSYVHGAVWLGHRDAVLRMCKELASRIDIDRSKGFVALWHDESHLNWYFANTDSCSLLPTHFSAWEKGWQFEPSQAYMLSLDKDELDKQMREKTS